MAKNNSRPPIIDILPEEIVGTLRQANKPLKFDELLKIMRVPRKRKKQVEFLLSSLEAEGTILRIHGSWAYPKKRVLVEGELSLQRSGAGFIICKEGGDVFVSPVDMGDAFDGDIVEAVILPGKRGPSKEGRIMRVVERSNRLIAVHAVKEVKGEPRSRLKRLSRKEQEKKAEGAPETYWICSPVNQGVQVLFSVDVSALAKDVAPHDLLLIKPEAKTGPGFWRATAVHNLETENTPAAQELLAKTNNGVPLAFPPSVLTEAETFGADPSEKDFVNRRDLRPLDFVTIDGADARDFDDAIHVIREEKSFLLRVAIADVSHYVRQGDAIDREARVRGNSYYFPLSVEPMLPEALSNGLCSLRPDVPRLALVAEMRFNERGEEIQSEYYAAVIESKARLTYDLVRDGLLEGKPEAQQKMHHVLPMLQNALELAKILSAMRQRRGSLDFNLPEAGFTFSEQGAVSGIAPREHHFAHQLIEEFMVAANESVARFLTKKHIPLLYRVHPAPDGDKLISLMSFLQTAGLAHFVGKTGQIKKHSSIKSGKKLETATPTLHELNDLLTAVRGTEKEYIISRLLLRSMMQARYSPENEGHFGIASQCYCHFTSPIRRYADLTVHRGLKLAFGEASSSAHSALRTHGDSGKNTGSSKQLSTANLSSPVKTTSLGAVSPSSVGAGSKKTASVLSGPEKEYLTSMLASTADHINMTERSAMEAEREVQKRLAILYLENRVGEEFEGIISGVTDFGIFVELPEFLAEGMIRLGLLDDDFYEYYPDRMMLQGRHTGRIFRIGDTIRVTLSDVSLARIEINFIPAGTADGERRKAVRGDGRLANKDKKQPPKKRTGPSGRATEKKRGNSTPQKKKTGRGRS